MKKEYQVSDLFYTSWDQLTQEKMMAVIDRSDRMLKHGPGSLEYGLEVIAILRAIRKSPRLVNKINVDQALDCFNDIAFFHRQPNGTFQSPWLFFPVAGFHANGKSFIRPEMNGSLPMYNRSFEQLIYADSSFSAFCVLNHQYRELPSKDLERDMDSALCSLIAVLYQAPSDFNVGNTEKIALSIPRKLTLMDRALILHTYANVRMFITNRCPNLFPKPPEDDSDNEKPPVYTGEMWMNLRYDLAKTEVFRGLKTANDAMIYDALDFLEKEAFESSQRKPLEHV